MKANELMIGDWVYCNYPSIKKNVRVDQIRRGGDDELKIVIVDVLPLVFTPEDIDPIPLTPEILEKNGFRDISDHTLKGAETYCLTMGEYCEIKITYKLGDYFAYDYYDDRWYRQFETSLCYRWCVHTLQHALRLCGIDKEIDL